MVESKGDDHGGDHDHDHDHDHDGEGSGENFCDELWFDDPDKWENVQDVESVDEDTVSDLVVCALEAVPHVHGRRFPRCFVLQVQLHCRSSCFSATNWSLRGDD